MSAHKILVIEDNPLNMELTTDILEEEGYVVIQAENAELGISLARAEPPGLILMDISLPGLDGLEATQILKGDAETRSIPIIALTAHAMKGDEDMVRTAGCDGYLTKPLNTEELPNVVARFLATTEKGEA